MSTAAAGYVGPYPFFHLGAVELHFLEPIAVDTDPTIDPGWARPIGWRVATADGLSAWDKTGPADTDWTPIAAPTPPSGAGAHAFDVTLSYGLGIDADQELPDFAVSFWLGPHTVADWAVDGQQREWSIDGLDLQWIGIEVVLYSASGLPEGGIPLIITNQGTDTAVFVTAFNTAIRQYLFSEANVDCEGSIGVRVDGSAFTEGMTLRCTVRLIGDDQPHA